jgi:aerobic-type carbon monoxide dehydrogenase small subunit (CoxS/CutS family)
VVTVKINGQQKNWDGDPDLPLLWFLRDEVGLTGTKYPGSPGPGMVKVRHSSLPVSASKATI